MVFRPHPGSDTLLRAHGPALLPGGQLDSNPSGRHRRAVAAGTLLRADLQRYLTLHPQYLRGLRIIPVSLLPLLQLGSVADGVVDPALDNLLHSLHAGPRADENEDLFDQSSHTVTRDHVKSSNPKLVKTAMLFI